MWKLVREVGALEGILCMWKAIGGLEWKATQGETDRNIIKAEQLFKGGVDVGMTKRDTLQKE